MSSVFYLETVKFELAQVRKVLVKRIKKIGQQLLLKQTIPKLRRCNYYYQEVGETSYSDIRSA